MSVSQKRALVAQARAATQRPVTPAASVASPAAPYEASPASAVSAAAPSVSAVGLVEFFVGFPGGVGGLGVADLYVADGPGRGGGELRPGLREPCDGRARGAADGQHRRVQLQRPAGVGQVQVTWTQECGQSSATIATQTVTAPSIFGTSPAVVASAPFTALTACAGQDVASDISDVTPEYQVAATATVVGGSAGSTDDDLFWIDVPLSELIACPGSLDSAGAGNPQGNCGDPVDTASGAFADSFTDATVRSAGYRW